MNQYVATFYTHYGALKFNKQCQKQNLNSKLIPVPRKLSSSCGTCVRFEADSHDILYANGIPEDLEGCYIVTGKDEYKTLNITDNCKN